MKSVTFIALLLATSGTANAANDDHHHQHAAESAESSTKRFAADKELRTRMEIIMTTMDSLHAEKMPKAQVQAAGTKIEKTVQDIFKNCKLEPEADAAIHPILAKILEAANLLKKGERASGHAKLHEAVARYEKKFIHAGRNH